MAETILQFGSGRFLRAFADYFVDVANKQGQGVGQVVIVQSTGGERAGNLAANGGKYHLLTRGLENGQVIDRVEEVGSVSRALVAATQWADVRALAKSPGLKFILSNTTEAGYALDRDELPSDSPPKSFPAKLTAVLKDRFDAGRPGLTIIPCELIEGNARLLRETVLGITDKWGYTGRFREWVTNECVWLHTLVDRIVVGPPKDHPLTATDPMVIMAEPFAFWALESHPKAHPFATHPAITRTPDVLPYFLRKVRILNAAHTALLIKAMPRGFAVVRDAIADPDLGPWLERLLFEEIVPALGDRVDGGEQFARDVLERFKNPFFEHLFSDIYKQHAAKVKVRLEPTVAEYTAKFGNAPPLLSEVLAENENLSP